MVLRHNGEFCVGSHAKVGLLVSFLFPHPGPCYLTQIAQTALPQLAVVSQHSQHHPSSSLE